MSEQPSLSRVRLRSDSSAVRTRRVHVENNEFDRETRRRQRAFRIRTGGQGFRFRVPRSRAKPNRFETFSTVRNGVVVRIVRPRRNRLRERRSPGRRESRHTAPSAAAPSAPTKTFTPERDFVCTKKNVVAYVGVRTYTDVHAQTRLCLAGGTHNARSLIIGPSIRRYRTRACTR